MAHETPFLKTVTLANASQAYLLSALLNALDPDVCATPLSSRCQYLQLQFDPAAGADVLNIGNSDVSLGNYGVQLVGTQAWVMQSVEGNLIRLDHIWLFSSGPGHVVSVAMLIR